MELGTLLPWSDIGGEPAVIREYAQAAESIGYHFLEAPDHVLGVNAASRPGWDRNDSEDLFHDPFVLFGYLAGCTTRLGFSTGVLILPQRQTVLVAKQAACLDVLSGGRFRLGIGVGWNEVEFTGLNENFHNRGRRSEEQVEVMQKLWASPHVSFKGAGTRSRMRASTRGPPRARCRCGLAAIMTAPWSASPNGATAGCRTPILPAPKPPRCWAGCAV
jgi:probable F420-dependent oxidoreductase